MHRHSSRFVIALLLASNLFLSANVGMARARRQTPAQEPAKAPAQTSAQDGPKASSSPEPSPIPVSTGPLSTDEDPAMIGKRKIPSGIIAKMSMSVEKEVALGRQLAAEVDRQAKFIDDPVITEYVNRVAQNLVLHSDAKIPFTVKVIDSDEVNAFALPGGFFYVNKGLILAADTEAQLAGVMAHEISHVIARHAVRNQTKAEMMQYGALAGIIFGGPILGNILYNTSGLGMMVTYMKFSRNAEAEADKLGVQYLYAAGYDPNALATMFEKLEGLNKKKPGAISKLFMDHPAPADRRAASLALAGRFPVREEYVINTSEFQRVRARLLKQSNARATTAGSIASTDDGTSGRPSLKRRQPTPDDTSTTPQGSGTTGQPTPDTNQSDPPKLKRKDATDSPATTDSSKNP
jgi:Zn-dependent protease with chaperone function